MITTMAESGSNEEQTEFFILNSQKVPRLPDEEPVWSLPSVPSSTENDETLLGSCVSTLIDEPNPSMSKRKPGINSNWPPAGWKTAPGFSLTQGNGMSTQAGSGLQMRKEDDDAEEFVAQRDHMAAIEIDADWTIVDDPAETSTVVLLQDSETSQDQSECTSNMSNSSETEKLSFGSSNSQQELLTGRVGEFVAFKYFARKAGERFVKWVNEANETGLPYDIVVGEVGKSREYIEVKATKSASKDWFAISVREWQFAVEKGESFSIAHVVLLGNNVARVKVFKNPLRLCELGKLHLAVVMSKQQKEFSTIS